MLLLFEVNLRSFISLHQAPISYHVIGTEMGEHLSLLSLSPTESVNLLRKLGAVHFTHTCHQFR